MRRLIGGLKVGDFPASLCLAFSVSVSGWFCRMEELLCRIVIGIGEVETAYLERDMQLILFFRLCLAYPFGAGSCFTFIVSFCQWRICRIS